MPFIPNPPKPKVDARYKTLYISRSLLDAIEQIAITYHLSFNSVVISMIEHCLQEDAAYDLLR